VHPSGGNNAATTTLPPAWQPMADQLAEADNAKLYRQRAAIIEPVFALWVPKTHPGLWPGHSSLAMIELCVSFERVQGSPLET
jgi:hypothetical protein